MSVCIWMHSSHVQSEKTRWSSFNKQHANLTHLTPKRRNYLMNNPLWINYANFLMSRLQESIKQKSLSHSFRRYMHGRCDILQFLFFNKHFNERTGELRLSGPILYICQCHTLQLSIESCQKPDKLKYIHKID